MDGTLNAAGASEPLVIQKDRALHLGLDGSNFVGTVTVQVSRTSGEAWETARYQNAPLVFTGTGDSQLDGRIASLKIINESNGVELYRVCVSSFTSGSVDFSLNT